MSSLILHEYSKSGNCYKIRLTAALLGLPLERREYDILKGETLWRRRAASTCRATPRSSAGWRRWPPNPATSPWNPSKSHWKAIATSNPPTARAPTPRITAAPVSTLSPVLLRFFLGSSA